MASLDVTLGSLESSIKKLSGNFEKLAEVIEDAITANTGLFGQGGSTQIKADEKSAQQAFTESFADSFGGAGNFGITSILAKFSGALHDASKAAKKLGDDALAGAAQALGDTMASISTIAGGIGGIFTAFIGAIDSTISYMRGFAALASPSAESTLRGNLQLLAQTIGSELVPIIKMFSGLVHLTNINLQMLIATAKTAIGALVNLIPGGGLGAAALAKLIEDLGRLGPQNIVLGVTARTSGNPGDFADRLQEAAFKADTNQTDTQILQNQLAQLMHSGKLLQNIDQTLTRQQGPGWGR